MDKELKILSGAVLTMLIYGLLLLLDGKPFVIYPLSTMTNFGLTVAIVFFMRKFDWRNIFYLITATSLLFQDPLFMSFFNVELSSYGVEHKTILSTVLIVLSNVLLAVPMIEKDKMRLLLLSGITIVAILTFLFVGVYGMFFTTVLATLYCVTSSNKNIEFLKVYNMFFIFMLLNQVAAHILYEI